MSGEAIGLSVGAGEETSLKEFLGREPGPEGMFFSASYDTAAYLDYTGELAQPPVDDGSDGDPAHASHAIGMAARSAFRDMADRSYTTLRFGPAGLVIDGHMTFKP
jgi:hypothetical protein